MPGLESLQRQSGTRKTFDRCVQTVCQECTAGCGLRAWVQDEIIVDVAGDDDHPVSRGRLCARGLAFLQALRHADRVTLPGYRLRPQGAFEAFDNWEKGLDYLAERLKRIQSQHPPEALAIACDPMAGLDFLLGAQRFAQLWGTPHVYHPLDDPEWPSAQLPLKAPTLSCTDWPRAGTLLLVEADLAVTHPVMFQWVQAARRQGAQIVVCDSRFAVSASQADVFLMIRPNTGNLLGAWLTRTLLDANVIPDEPADRLFRDATAWRASYVQPRPDLAAATGVTADQMQALGGLVGHHHPVTIITGKRLAFQEDYPIWLTLAAAMGWLSVPGGGWYPLESGQVPLEPAADIPPQASTSAFATPTRYPYQTRKAGYPVASHTLTQTPISTLARALIGSGNCLNDFLAPIAPQVREMDLVACFGSFPNQTRQQAHIFFPATLWPEREGICFSDDRRLQWANRIVAPSDACRTGLGFWMRLARRLGWEDHFEWRKASGMADQAAFYNWLLARRPITRGITVELLQQPSGGLVWPFEQAYGLAADIPDDRMIPAAAPAAVATGDVPDAQHPLRYQATRIAARHSDASHWQPWSRELADEQAVQIHPDTARALGLNTGDLLMVTANGDSFEGKTQISRMVPRDMVWSKKRLGHSHVVVYQPSQDIETARRILGELLQ